MTETTFHGLGLAEPLLRALESEKHSTPTPIQAQAIPHLLNSQDLLGIAQTGTGKTAAFTLPILHALVETRQKSRTPRALILAPTRELAVQIGERLGAYGQFTGLRHVVIFGGVSQNPQVRALQRGVDIVVATPGRLLDLYQQGHAKLDRISMLVLDEADRMLDMGFVHDMRKIVAAIPAERQSLLFSATMPKDVARLAQEILHKPVRVEVTPEVITVDRIDQQVHFVDGPAKRSLLTKLLDDPELSRVIVFTRTKHGANRVAEQLEKAGVPADALHGNKSQNARQRALDSFRSGNIRVLVATDIAARGIDVPEITHVINFELPNVAESYVHRIGRTARAGAEGVAISFCDPSERGYLRDIERLTKRPMTVVGGNPGRSAEGAREKGNVTKLAANSNRAAEQDGKPNSNRRRRPRRGGTRRVA